MIRYALIVSALALAGAAAAQAPPAALPPGVGPATPAAKGPPTGLALEAAEAALEACAAAGYKVTVLVTDAEGQPLALVRDDGTSPRTLQIAQRKARTALEFKVNTLQMADRIKADPALAERFATDTSVIYWGGSRPILSGGDVVGAIAVSGAPGGDKDDACIEPGLAKIADRL